MRAEVASVRARFDHLDRGAQRSGWARFPVAPLLWTLTVVAAAAGTWDASWELRPAVEAALGWSARQVLDGQPWRTLSATVLTTDALSLAALVVVTATALWVLERLTSTRLALAVWAAGAVWGFVGTTLALRAGAAAGWGLAEATLTTPDVGPSGGTAAVVAVVVVLVRHRLVTAVTVLALLVGSAVHHEVADVEHLLVFATTLLLAPLLLRGRAGTRSRAAP